MKARVYIFVVLILFCITTGCDKCSHKEECIISFDITDGKGTVPEPMTYEEGEKVELSSLPKEEGFSCTGHRLNGWSRVKEGEVLTSDFSVESDMTLYAVWKQNDNSDEKIVDDKVSVHFNRNGGEGNDTTYVVEKGETIYYYGFPSSVFKTDYTLSGWSVYPNGQPIDYSITITCDTTLYAIWQLNYVKVDFCRNDGKGSIDTTWMVERNQYIYSSKFPTPIWENYTFKGWSASSDGDIIRGSIQVSRDTTLFARWNRLYKVTFNINGGIGTTPDTKEVEDGNYLYSFDLPNSSKILRDGYTFRGWSQSSTGEPISGNLRITSNTTLYAVWTKKTYQITFDINGGRGMTPNIKEIEDGFYLYSSDLPDGEGFSYPGYKFNGWAETANGEPLNYVKVTDDMTLYAVWVKNMFKISFNLNGGSGLTPNAIEFEQGGYLYTNTLPTDSGFSREGYGLKGWSDQPNGDPLKKESYRVTGDAVLYAVWKKICIISFDINGGVGLTPCNKEVLENDYYYLSDFPSNAYFSREGYVFKGWSTVNYGQHPLTRESYSTTEDIKLYAVWNKLYTISYDLNGGTGQIPNQITIENGSYLYYSDFPNGLNFSRNGYTFEGWSEWSSGNPINYDIYVMENKTLFAIWKQEKPEKPREPSEPSIIGGYE